MTTTQSTKENRQFKLTELEQKLLAYYKEYHKENKTHPNVSFVAKHYGVTRQAVTHKLENLVNKGYLRKVYRGAFIHTIKKC